MKKKFQLNFFLLKFKRKNILLRLFKKSPDNFLKKKKNLLKLEKNMINMLGFTHGGKKKKFY